MIKSYLSGEQTNWDANLGGLAAAYRSTPNESIRLTPPSDDTGTGSPPNNGRGLVSECEEDDCDWKGDRYGALEHAASTTVRWRKARCLDTYM